ncbi:MAG: glycosyl transferase family 1 [Pelagibacteraceae bacterium TMED287]|nr:MAG: glycosyl transferase family 1 [Pelagibacteraceae bacterium TMED287]
MKISILLPYKENFSPVYPGAVSLFVNDTLKLSKFKKSIKVYGNTSYKKKFSNNYKNIKLKRMFFGSQSENYMDEFIKIEKSSPSQIIEIHNRPHYLKYLIKEGVTSKFVLYFHNDPLTMTGSKSLGERKYIVDICDKIIFNSQWSKKRFLEKFPSGSLSSEKLIVIFQSASKNKVNLSKKKKWITFVGKLNRSKGYDIFGSAVIKVLNKNKDWHALVIGDEHRDKIVFKHKRLKNLGFLNHKEVIKIFKKTSIAVACSRWNEPFGRTSLEGSANACAVIISNKGGLPETVTNAIILQKLNQNELKKKIDLLIKNKTLRTNYQKLAYKNFYLTHKKSSNDIDSYREEILVSNRKLNYFQKTEKLRIVHVTNFNERHDGRLYFNTGRRINNGLIRLGHSILDFSDRDIQKYYKNYKDLSGSKKLNSKLVNTCYNFRPDMIVLGHADSIYPETLRDLKKNYPNLKIAQWFLDPLNKKGPDFDKNKERILNKVDYVDENFLTTSPKALSFIKQKDKFHFIPNPADSSFETLNNFDKSCNMDVFYALSHGVHRGVLKRGKFDDRINFVSKLMNITPNIKFDVYGANSVQPVWADNYLKAISNSKMGLNLSRGEPIKYYSSDRITQIIGNGLVTLIDEKTCYRDFFNDEEMVFYKNLNDLSEKIVKVASDEKLRKKIGKNGKKKYLKYFNSTNVAKFIINKSLDIKSKNKYIWEK